MSEENVKTILRGIEALNRGDVEAALAPFHPEIEFSDAGTGHHDRGISTFRADLISWLEPWAHYSEEVEEVLDLGDAILLSVRATGEGRASGATLDEHHAELHEFEDGVVVKMTVYPTAEDALKEAGLSE